MKRGREILREAVGATAQCVPIERLCALTAIEYAHAATCAHCEAELRLYYQFEANEAAADEGAAVQWIAAEVGRRLTAQPVTRRREPWSWFSGRAVVALAAALVMMVGSLLIDREPSIGTQPSDTTYRGTAIRVTSADGDVARAPGMLQWQPVSGASSYDVVIHEVDGTPIWNGSTTEPTVTLPAAVVSQFAPGRSMTWEVTARNSSGAIVATSGVHRFRVQPRR